MIPLVVAAAAPFSILHSLCLFLPPFFSLSLSVCFQFSLLIHVVPVCHTRRPAISILGSAWKRTLNSELFDREDTYSTEQKHRRMFSTSIHRRTISIVLLTPIAVTVERIKPLRKCVDLCCPSGSFAKIEYTFEGEYFTHRATISGQPFISDREIRLTVLWITRVRACVRACVRSSVREPHVRVSTSRSPGTVLVRQLPFVFRVLTVSTSVGIPFRSAGCRH